MKLKSYRSDKTKVLVSPIHGKGLFAVKNILKGEVVAIKGGHIIEAKSYKAKKNIIGEAECQIADGFYLAPLTKAECKDIMIFLNHSCEPNTGIMGNIVFVAMKDIPKNSEITIDYAFYKDERTFKIHCECGAKKCRKIVTGKDWERKDLQKKYKSYFSSYLRSKMA